MRAYIIPYAPQRLDVEIRKHAEEHAQQAGCGVAEYLAVWEGYKEQISFFDAPETDVWSGPIPDPDDVPYTQTFKALGAHAVYSEDPHIDAMGLPTIDHPAICTLQAYSRAASWQYSMRYGGMVVTLAGWELFSVSVNDFETPEFRI